jgi:hypothetical protein
MFFPISLEEKKRKNACFWNEIHLNLQVKSEKYWFFLWLIKKRLSLSSNFGINNNLKQAICTQL